MAGKSSLIPRAKLAQRLQMHRDGSIDRSRPYHSRIWGLREVSKVPDLFSSIYGCEIS